MTEEDKNKSDEYWASSDGKTLWVNSGTKCVLRINGLDKLKGMESIKSKVCVSLGGMSDITVIGGEQVGDTSAKE